MRHQVRYPRLRFTRFLKYNDCVQQGVLDLVRKPENCNPQNKNHAQFKLKCPGKDSSLTSTSPRGLNPWLIFGTWVTLSLLLFAKPVFGLIQLARNDDTASHILLIPFISAWLLYTERKEPQRGCAFKMWPAVLFLVASALMAILPLACNTCAPGIRLSGYALSLVLLVVAGFVFTFGPAAAKSSWFALAFLLFTVPIPEFFLGKIIYWLQAGSATIAEFFFNLSGTPVLRQGFVFHLPKMSIEVAQECSGIRSSLALLILALLVAHFSFRPFWKKLVFVAAGLCMMLVKNGIRIASLTLLANYVNPAFLTGNLHHHGGVVFFLIGLALLLPVFWILRSGEARTAELSARQE
jgi:exosortase